MLAGSLGHYEIQSLLGEGGMGQVYRARDAKLGRAVAIKVVPDAFKADADRAARFEREAKLLAALNHANIAALYGLEEAEGHRFLVLELVEGDTLADRLARGPLQIEEALRIALQIADALEAAHEKGIIHRDLKPANVKLTVDDRVKVLDFGLAKAVAADSELAGITRSPTLSIAATNAGVVLGTAAYMSPEQAKGLTADHRSDIFSFGVVLHEMLTGRQPFQGETAAEVMAAVIVRDSDLSGLSPDLNPRLVDLLKRCLEKNPKKRWQAIGDVRAEIEAVASAPRRALRSSSDTVPARPLWQRALVPAATAVGGTVLGAALVYTTLPVATPPVVTRFTIPLGDGQAFTNTGRQLVAISRDGSKFAYVANFQIYLREFSSSEARIIAGNPKATSNTLGVTSPVFSPDGLAVAYFDATDQALKKVSVSGGAPITICAADNPYGMTWGEEGLIFAQLGKGILRVPPNRGDPEVIFSITGDELAYGPQILPDGRTVLFTLASGVRPDRWDKASIVAQRIGSTDRRVIVENASDARYLTTGHLVFSRAGVVFAQPFDRDALQTSGGPLPVIEGVRRVVGAAPGTAASHFSISETGSVVFMSGPASPITTLQDLAIVDRSTGNVAPLKLLAGSYQHARVSPDGSRIAFGTDDGKEAAVYSYALDGSTSIQRRTFGGNNRYPIWSADGTRITFQSDRDGDSGIFWQPADGTGIADRLTTPEQGAAHIPDSWSPSGEILLFTVVSPGTPLQDAGARARSTAAGFQLWAFSRKERTATRIPGIESVNPIGATFAPDGRWFAYSTNSPSQTQSMVFVEPYPPTGAKYQISKNDDSHHPIWSRDGKELFVTLGPNSVSAFSVQTQPTFTYGSVIPSAAGRMMADPPNLVRNHDVLLDGKRFVDTINANQAGALSTTSQVEVILNWAEELKTRVPIH